MPAPAFVRCLCGLTLAALALDNLGVSHVAAEVGSTANSYQILAKLATGGMAEIFLARGEGVAGVERYCVLKRILRERASDVHFVRMFLDLSLIHISEPTRLL